VRLRAAETKGGCITTASVTDVERTFKQSESHWSSGAGRSSHATGPCSGASRSRACCATGGSPGRRKRPPCSRPSSTWMQAP